MKLDCILTAVNENELYIDFVIIFIKTWHKLYPEVDVKIILIAQKIPENLLPYTKNIILFAPIENVLTSFTSQIIRLLYPCILKYKNGVMITDIDILPMNSQYYTKNIIDYNDDKFIYYRENIGLCYKQIFMCYNVATPEIWKDIFKINSIDDITIFLKTVSDNNEIIEGHGKKGWCTDQLTLYKKVIDWNKQTDNFVQLNDDQNGFNRLDRNKFHISNIDVQNNIAEGKYSDYHCFRPMSKYYDVNWKIYNLLPETSKSNEKFFVSFTTNDNYCELAEIMIQSLSMFSDHKIILYCVDFDKPKYADNYSNLICKRIDWKNQFNIFYLKPLIILDAITNMSVVNGVYIESDDIATKTIDNLFKECERISYYPLCPIHPRDPNNQRDIMNHLSVSKKSMPYVHGHIVFSHTTKLFIEEWYNACIELGNKARANWDETILNVIFWKHGINDYIDYIYDPYYTHVKKLVSKEISFDKVYMLHGSKNKDNSIKILEQIKLL